MGGDGVSDAKRHLSVFLVATSGMIIVLGAWAVSPSSDKHSVGPETVTLEPGDWTGVDAGAHPDWTDFRFELEIESQADLDVAIAHDGHGLKGDPSLLRLCNRPIGDSSYADTVISRGKWKDEVDAGCDCGVMPFIDNTQAGRVNQTVHPVTVPYRLEWSWEPSLVRMPQFQAMLLFVVAVPTVGFFLWKEVDREEAHASVLEGKES